MKKKNILLTLTLPLLVLCACGEGDSSSSNHPETSSSEVIPSSASDSNGETSSSESDKDLVIGEEDWKKAFLGISNCTILTSAQGKGLTSSSQTEMGEEAIKVTQTSKEEGGETSFNSHYYIGKNADGSYTKYSYVEEAEAYAASSYEDGKAQWAIGKSLLSAFASSYASFSYQEDKKGYYAESVTYAYEGKETILGKDVLVLFEGKALNKVSFSAVNEEDSEVKVQGVISNFGSTVVSLPSIDQVKEGLLAELGDWVNAMNPFKDERNARIAFTKVQGDESNPITIVAESDYDGNSIHSITLSEGTSDGQKVSAETEVYFSVEDEVAYSYAKNGSGLYRKSVYEATYGPWEIYDSLALAFLSNGSYFTYDKESDAYLAQKLDTSIGGFEKLEDLKVIFSYGELSSISFTSDGGEYKIDEIGKIHVTLPTEDQLYSEGMVSKEVYENALLSASIARNCLYKSAYSYDGGYSSYSTFESYLCDGNAIEYRNEQSYNGAPSSSAHEFYSLEDSVCYAYEEIDGVWEKKEGNETDKATFKTIEDAILLFGESYESLTFDKSSASYRASSLEINNNVYTDIVITFAEDQLESITYKNSGSSYEIAGFGQAKVDLPDMEKKGVITKDQWVTYFLEASEAMNFLYEYSEKIEDGEDKMTSKGETFVNGTIYLDDRTETLSGVTEESQVYGEKGTDVDYLYTKTDSGWKKSESDEVKKTFASLESCVLLFGDSYSSFVFDSEKNAFLASELTINDKIYTNVSVSFDEKGLKEVKWATSLGTYSLSGFGKMPTNLPEIA